MSDDCPLAEFSRWQRCAVAAADPMATCFVLATVGEHGRPSARVVSYRPGPGGEFRFFTNSGSRKGRELSDNPEVAALFFWRTRGRQVRLEGEARRVPAHLSDQYFDQRSLEHRVSAALSAQSQPIESIDQLRKTHARVVAGHRSQGTSPPRPSAWSGYELEIRSVELWQSGLHRLAERRLHRRAGQRWAVELLAP